MTNYTRENPSPKYKEYIEMYRKMHEEGDPINNTRPEDTFSGMSLKAQVGVVKNIIKFTNSKTMLDYGCGKARTYNDKVKLIVNGVKKEESITVKEFFDLDEIYLYDPANKEYSKYPKTKFDGVICIDVLEHVLEEDIDWLVKDLFALSNKFVFANVACYPARKILPNGENAHCTIKSLEWWVSKLYTVSAEYPDILYRFDFTVPDYKTKQMKKYTFANFSTNKDKEKNKKEKLEENKNI